MPFAGRLFYAKPRFKHKDRRSTAYHEATHAVIGTYWGIRIAFATIIPVHGGIVPGRVHWFPYDDGVTEQMYFSSLLAAAWGECLADEKLTRLPRIAYTLGADIPKDVHERKKFYPWKYDFLARKLVYNFIGEIRLVAEALLKRNRMTGYEIRVICGRPHESFLDRARKNKKGPERKYIKAQRSRQSCRK